MNDEKQKALIGRNIGETSVLGDGDDARKLLIIETLDAYPGSDQVAFLEDGTITTAQYVAGRVTHWYDPTTKTVTNTTTG